MNKVIWLLKWILKAAIFFSLFAFALNNQQPVVLHFYFGHQWVAPQILVVLAVFSVGLIVGFAAMGWTLRQRRNAQSPGDRPPVFDSTTDSLHPNGH